MFARLNGRAGHYLLLLSLGGVLFFPNLGGPSLWDLDEGRNATCSWEMMLSGNWIVPTFNGELRVDKPALLYWLQIAAYHAFGVNEFSARLASALAALATILLCYELGRSMFSATTGLIAVAAAGATPMLCGAARFANPDALLNLFVVLTLFVFWVGRQRPSVWWFAAIGAAEGFGMLAKGPVAVVLPAAIMVAFALWERRLDLLWDRRQLAAVLAFIIVAVPWYLLVSLETKGEFAAGFFFKHNVERALSTMENHRGGVWYYPMVIAVGTMPWSVFLGPALWFGLWSAIRQPWARCQSAWTQAAEQGGADAEASARRQAYRLLWCWGAVWVGVFTVAATKLPNYALPALVPTAILLARFLDRWRQGELRLARWVMPSSIVCLGLSGAAVSAGLVIASGASSLDPLAPWALVGIFPVVSASVGAWCIRVGRRNEVVWGVAVTGVLLLAPLTALGLLAVEGQKSARALVAQTGALQPTNDIRVVAWQLDHLPSINFYVQRNVRCCKEAGEVADYLHYPLPVFAFLPVTEWEQLRPDVHAAWHEAGRHYDLYKRRDVVVITNQPPPLADQRVATYKSGS